MKTQDLVNYACDKCGARDLKLWRHHAHAPEPGPNLLCAACLAPGVEVSDEGKAHDKYHYTDQIAGWVPAVPVGDTFWGYSSVPAVDVEWWKALPTYAQKGGA